MEYGLESGQQHVPYLGGQAPVDRSVPASEGRPSFEMKTLSRSLHGLMLNPFVCVLCITDLLEHT